MGISVDSFVKAFNTNLKTANKKGNGDDFAKFIGKHITTQYIPILVKEARCQGIIDVCTHTPESKEKVVKINSVSRHIIFIMTIIDLYTDLDIVFENGACVAQFDKLNEIGAISALISAIPESEYKEFETVLNMKMDDFYDNEYSVVALLYNLKQSFSLSEELIDEALKEVKDKLKKEK